MSKDFLKSLSDSLKNDDKMVNWLSTFDEKHSDIRFEMPKKEISETLKSGGYCADDYYAFNGTSGENKNEKIKYISSRIIRHYDNNYPLGMNEIRETIKQLKNEKKTQTSTNINLAIKECLKNRR